MMAVRAYPQQDCSKADRNARSGSVADHLPGPSIPNVQTKINKITDATAYFLDPGWFGDITLLVVAAYTLPSIRLARHAEC